VYLGWVTPSNVPQRRERLLGFVYSPYRADDLLAGGPATALPRAAFELYDGPIAPGSLLHRSPDFAASKAHADPALELARSFDVYGQTWTARDILNAGFALGSPSEFTALTLLAGLLVSVVLTAISWMQARARRT